MGHATTTPSIVQKELRDRRAEDHSEEAHTPPPAPADSAEYVFTMGRSERKPITREVYDSFVGDLVTSVTGGGVFAYGQTCSGKTYTMQGGGCEGGGGVGIIHLAAKDIFQFIEDDHDSSNSECSVRISYFEIYNEELRDLLNDNDDRSKSSTSLIIREGKNGSIAVDGLREVEVTNLDQIMKVFKIGEKHNAVGSTKMNYRSSRSHAILKIAIDRRMVLRRTTFDEEVKKSMRP